MSKKNPLPSQVENPKGLHEKFHMQKIIGYIKNKPMYSDIGVGEDYFVLRLDEDQHNKEHLEACRLAVASYANSIERTHPKVALEMRQRYLNIK